MLIKGEEVTIEGDTLCVIITRNGPVLEVEHSQDDEELYNLETIAILEKDQVSFDFDPYST